jgi:hypothetical protein
MDSDEKKMGAGSGGGPTARKDIDPHGDIRFVDGTFGRQADKITLLVCSDKIENTSLGLGCAGEAAVIQLTAERMVLIEARQPGDPTDAFGADDDRRELYEIIVSATKGRGILIQRGDPKDVASYSSIQMDSHGNVAINAGALRSLCLSVGQTTYINMTDEDITIAAETVNIQGHTAVNIN